MKSKELKTKISHAHSLILSLALYASVSVSLTVCRQVLELRQEMEDVQTRALTELESELGKLQAERQQIYTATDQHKLQLMAEGSYTGTTGQYIVNT